MRANQVRPGVLALELEKGDRRKATADELRSRGWGDEALRRLEGRDARRSAPGDAKERPAKPLAAK